ncbi:MAG: hypothetical protein AMQ22_02018 [Candidatus Methanofastidiosum methylothiophilum]|uniref:Resolvase/invertase-type recombinase catalytic domain-containing protein n=1 Tax=Candidatus Methanofastidiosum methylothiophilum TaxID=1705564 RepID=A0A150IPP8_9EURY|nr:MAG: hypothetical protein AMQ22_02018 [Candidatus Methanofastidiosum methylthiophilus]
MKAVGYARVSTKKQEDNLKLQEDQIKKYCDLRGYELMKIYSEVASGKDIERKEFKNMIKDVTEYNPLGVEIVVIYKLDRIGRSIIDVINISRLFEDKNIGFAVITQNLDTATKEGRLFFYIMGALAEYERELIMERTTLGRDRAKDEGKKFGRPKKRVPIEDIRQKIALGWKKSAIADYYGINRTTMYKRLNEEK